MVRSVMVPGGCHSHGCHGFALLSASVLCSINFLGTSLKLIFVDEFNMIINYCCVKFYQK